MAVECYVELAGIRVDPSILGRSVTVKRADWAYRIDFPEEPESFTFSRATSPDERDYQVTRSYIGDPERGFVEIRIVRIVVNAMQSLPDGALDRHNPDHDGWAHNVFFDLRQRALDAACDLTDLVRLPGQPTIEPTGRYPRILNLAQLVELSESEAKPFDWSIGQFGPCEYWGMRRYSAAEN